MIRSIVPLLAALATFAISASVRADVRAYAIVVGNNAPPTGEAGQGLSPLEFADDDAIRYAALFEQFARDTVLLTVLDTSTRRRFPEMRPLLPRISELRAALARLAPQMQADLDRGDDPVLYFAFSGHGATRADGEAFLSLLDGALTRELLLEDLLAPLPARQIHVILDACHAAGVVGIRGRSGVELDASTRSLERRTSQQWLERRSLARLPHIGVLVATTAGEQAHEWSALESGVFTHEVLSGLWGAADVNEDLRIEYSEIQAFVAAANRTVADPKAVPRVIARPPETDPHSPLVDLSALRQSLWITGDASELGHFHIELDNGQRHADVHRTGSLTIALPGAGTAFLRTDESEARIELRPGGVVGLGKLAMVERSTAPRGAIDAQYRRELYREPFSADYYRGYVDSAGLVGVRPSEGGDSVGVGPRATGSVSKAQPAPPSLPPLDLDAARRASKGPDRLDAPVERRARDRASKLRAGGWAMASLAVPSGGSAIVVGALAGAFKSAGDDRARSYTIAAATTGAFGALAGTAAILLLRAADRATTKD